MSVHYLEPLSRGVARMKKDLFDPFDLKRWFVIGFTAFLAGFGEFRSSGIPSASWRRRGSVNWEDVLYFPQRALEWLSNHPGWAIFIGIALFLGTCLGVVLTWLSSRGKFMFLDNVVRGQAKVSGPWYEYRKEGNSLFVWLFFWGLIVFAVIVAYLFYCILNLQAIFETGRNIRSLLLPAILSGLGLVFLSILTNFIYALVRDFVVPIMYRERITALEAIQRFSVLFSSQFIYFVWYGLLLIALWIVIGIGIVVLGCATCCVGFVILAIPYINAVVLLPISYALRAFSVEFLEQFGPEYRIFPRPEAIPPIPPAQPE